MVNSANTAFKITNLYNTSLFTFDSAGWEPRSERIGGQLLYKTMDDSYLNLKTFECLGLGPKQITMLGKDVSDVDRFKLSSALSKQQVMKLWLGEDWFYYVMPIEPTLNRDVTYPLLVDYSVAFETVDPHYYFANSAAGTGSGFDWVAPSFDGFTAAASGTCDIDLTDGTAPNNTCNIEPVFWITWTHGTITTVDFEDEKGRKLTYDPAADMTAAETHVVMPYRNTIERGFIPDTPWGGKIVTTNVHLPNVSANGHSGGNWAFDTFQHGAGTDDDITAANNAFGRLTTASGLVTKGSITLSRNGTTFLNRWGNYPLALDDVDNDINVTVNGSDTQTADVFATWLWSRL